LAGLQALGAGSRSQTAAAFRLRNGTVHVNIDNIDQYIGLEQSVCMKKELIETEEILNSIGDSDSSPLGDECINWKSLPIEYFRFEEEFVDQNMRCIPMIVRFKMDNAGIKLKLPEWSKFNAFERKELAIKPIETDDERNNYQNFLSSLIYKYTGNTPTLLEMNQAPEWAIPNTVPKSLIEKSNEFNWKMTTEQWSELTTLQRFALLKLCRPGHENRNFPKAMREFGMVSGES
jgi:hypothetical protein